MTKKSEALKGVSVTSVELVVDRAMEYLPLRTMDLALPENRAIVRNWMIRVGGVIVQENVESFTAAAKSAIDEAGALAIDPSYYKTIKNRRESYRARRAAIRATRELTKEQRAFASITDAKVLM